MSEQDAEKSCAAVSGEKNGVVLNGKKLPRFLAKVREEMKLVHYPGWQQVRSTTMVVISFVTLFALYLRILDWIFAPLDRWLFSR